MFCEEEGGKRPIKIKRVAMVFGPLLALGIIWSVYPKRQDNSYLDHTPKHLSEDAGLKAGVSQSEEKHVPKGIKGNDVGAASHIDESGRHYPGSEHRNPDGRASASKQGF